MISVEKVLFPGIAAGCLFLVLVASLITNPTIALAAGSAPGNAFAQPLPNGAAQAGAAAAGAVGAARTASNLTGNNQQAQAAAQNEQPAQAQEQADGAQEGSCSLGSGFPDSIRQWCGSIERAASENGLDPNLLASVMLQESGGNPRAYSKSGAVGLLQVMPRDGLASGFMCINGPCFSSRPSTDELYNPDFNISYGASLLAGLVQKYGDVREALRNYGPMDMGYRYADIILSIYNRYR